MCVACASSKKIPDNVKARVKEVLMTISKEHRATCMWERQNGSKALLTQVILPIYNAVFTVKDKLCIQ